MQYVDIDYVKAISSMPAADIDALEDVYPGTFARIAEAVSRMFDGRLSKRYVTPIADPVPEELRMKVADVVVFHLWNKRGRNPGAAQDSIVDANYSEALKWLAELADSQNGLIELPARPSGPVDASAVVRGGPLAYSEPDAYTWTDRQAEAVSRGR